MNGAPMPPDPTGPPDWFLFVLFVLFVVGIVFMFVVVFIAEARERRRKALEDKQEVLAETLAQEKENLENYRIQMLINQSPGGRKPWQ